MNAQKTAPLTALHATGGSVVDVGGKNMEGRHVGLDFYDLLIEPIMNRILSGVLTRKDSLSTGKAGVSTADRIH